MSGKETKKTTSVKYNNQSNYKKQFSYAWPILEFACAVFLLFLVIIPGENIWLALHNFTLSLFGVCSILWPLFLGLIAVLDAMGKISNKPKVKLWLSIFTIMFACSLFYVFAHAKDQVSLGVIFQKYFNGEFNKDCGIFGALIGAPLIWAFGVVGARISNCILLFVTFMILTGTTLLQFFSAVAKPAQTIKRRIDDKSTDIKLRRDSKIDIDLGAKKSKPKKEVALPEPIPQEQTIATFDDDISAVTEKFISKVQDNAQKSEEFELESKDEFSAGLDKNHEFENYQFPPIDLLQKTSAPNNGDISSELNNNGKMLVDTLKSFNVQTKIVDISRGPAVTRYELQPAAGVKISKITTLADDIALNLAASGVRIEAPIPGKAAVGIEIPNKVVSMVSMRELVASSEFKNAKSKLTVVLGRDISGNIMTADLAKMPHLLIAGSTGSGKSVCINSFIISILYNARPDEVKLLMVDPKVVELGVYNGIPHLLVPVVTDARKAAGALNWAVNEMLKRYKKFAENNVRDLSSYNAMIEENPNITDENGEILEKMPQIVIIIDELSDLMMAAPNEVEDYICRLAQMARAAGMHLVIATQRPSVDVITGIIKANIPSRIALAVSSQIDSRTILDMSGAEKLLGRGDMLFAPVGIPKPVRIQGCYVTDREIEKIVDFVKSTQESNYDSKIAEEIEKNTLPENSKKSDNNSAETAALDPVMIDAIKCVIEAGQASTSFLQRRLRVGYARAGRLIDEMEQMGIVGPHEGSKPRQVLINYQQFLEMNLNKAD